MTGASPIVASVADKPLLVIGFGVGLVEIDYILVGGRDRADFNGRKWVDRVDFDGRKREVEVGLLNFIYFSH